MSARTANDVWAVGNIDRAGVQRTLVRHWDGATWRKTSSVDPGATRSYLLGVTTIAADDAWAVGAYNNGGPDRVLIEHWDGSSWSQVQAPRDVPVDSELRDVAAVSADDVWAVGITRLEFGDAEVVLLHWDGTAWSRIENESPGWLHRELTGVVALSSHNIWAVGSGYQDEELGQIPIALHGPSWDLTLMQAEDRENDQPMLAVDAVSWRDIWSVGYYEYGPLNRPSAEHYDGERWRIVSTPTSDGTELHGVAAIATDDVWAVGSSDADNVEGAYILHWDGTEWSQIAAPAPAGSALNAVDGVAADDVWAVGTAGPQGRRVPAFIEHWDGEHWTVVSG